MALPLLPPRPPSLILAQRLVAKVVWIPECTAVQTKYVRIAIEIYTKGFVNATPFFALRNISVRQARAIAMNPKLRAAACAERLEIYSVHKNTLLLVDPHFAVIINAWF